MLNKKGKILICVLTILVIIFMLFSTIDISANEGSAKEGSTSFHQPSVNVSYKQIFVEFQEPEINDYEEYIKISVDNCSFLFDKGKPLLPMKTVVINLQFKTNVSSVDVDVETKEKTLNKKLMLSPNPQPLDKQNVDNSNPVLPEIYPEEWYEYNVMAGIDPETNKETNFLIIRFYPVRYIENENKIVYATSANIKIGYNEERVLKDIDGKGLYDMVVISPSLFSTVVENFTEYKNDINIMTKAVTLDEIYNSTYFVAQGRDNQERIKCFIYNATKEWGISYVLLAGDTNVLPVRYAYIEDEYDEYVPTDLYYADVFDSNGDFCSWDDNSNNVFGEFNVDGVDGGADVYIGRLPASDADEMQILVDKIMGYELPDNTAWFNNALLVGTNTFTKYVHGDNSGIPEGEYTKNHIADYYMSGFNVTKLYETDIYQNDGDATTDNILNSINKGVGFADFSDHGSYSGVIYLNGGTGPCMLTSTDVDTLANGNKLPVVIADACSTNGFDSGECLGEHFMLNSNGGSIAFIGSTRVGWGYHGQYVIERYSGYMDVHLHKAYQEKKDTPGEMLVTAQNDYISEIGFSSVYDYKTVLEYNLLGDPSLHIGGGVDVKPPTSSVNPISPYSLVSPFIITGNANDTLPGSGLKNVSLYYRYSEDNSSWSSYLFYGVDENVETGVSWKFYADYIGYYQFYSIAADNAGNIEEKPSIADAECHVSNVILYGIENVNVIDDVAFQGSPTSDSVKLTWVSPEWRADSYDIGYRKMEDGEVNEANWYSPDTHHVSYDPTPNSVSPPGKAEQLWVSGLIENTEYSFAVRGRNLGGFISNISGCGSISTLDIITWVGTKIITDITYINRTELHVAGDLYIASKIGIGGINKTGKLSLDNSFLILDSTVDFQYRIWVAPSLSGPGYLEGGGLYIYKSNITSSYGKYILKVWPKGDFSLRDSSIRYCGGALEDISPEYFERGLDIYSGETCIEDSLISECRGVFVYVSMPNIIDTTFKDNYYGVKFESVMPTEGTPVVPAYVNLLRNDFINNNIGVFCDGSRVRLTECNFMSNNYGAIYNSTPTDFPHNVSGVIYHCVFENNTVGINSITSSLDLETVTMVNNTYALNATASVLTIKQSEFLDNAGGIYCSLSSLDVFDSAISNSKALIEFETYEKRNVTETNYTETVYPVEEEITSSGNYSYGILSLLTPTNISGTIVVIDVDGTITTVTITTWSDGSKSTTTMGYSDKVGIGVLCAGRALNFIDNGIRDSCAGLMWMFSEARITNNTFQGCIEGVLGSGTTDIPDMMDRLPGIRPPVVLSFAPILRRILQGIEEINVEGALSGNEFVDNVFSTIIFAGNDITIDNSTFTGNIDLGFNIVIDGVEGIVGEGGEGILCDSSTFTIDKCYLLNYGTGIDISSSTGNIINTNTTGIWSWSINIVMSSSNCGIYDSVIDEGYVGILYFDSTIDIKDTIITDNPYGNILSLHLYYWWQYPEEAADIVEHSVLTIDNGTILRSAYYGGGHGIATANTTVTITNSNISENDVGIYCEFTDVILENMNISDNTKDGVYVSASTLIATHANFTGNTVGISASNAEIHVTECDFKDNSRHISSSWSSGYIELNTIKGGTGVDSLYSDLYISDNYFIDCIAGINSNNDFLEITGNVMEGCIEGIKISYAASANITGNKIDGLGTAQPYTRGIMVLYQGSGEVYIADNEIWRYNYLYFDGYHYGNGIYCSSDACPTIVNNILAENAIGICFENLNEGYAIIEENTIYGDACGICSVNSNLNIINNSIGWDIINDIIRWSISSPPFYRGIGTYGIYGQNSELNIIGNDINHNYYGVGCEGSTLNVTGNSLSWNTYGIHVIPYITQSVTLYSSACINGATISNNSYGAYFKESSLSISNTSIVNNNIVNDSYGVYLYECPDPEFPGIPVKIVNSTITNNIMDLNISDSRVESVTSTIGIIYLSSSTISSTLDCVDFTPDFNNITFADNNSKMVLSFYLTVFVKWQNNEPVNNASITIYDKNNVPTNLSTDINGVVYTKILALRLNKTTLPDGVRFMPHRVNASKYDISNETKEIWVNKTHYVELVLYDMKNPSISINPVFFNITNKPLLTITGTASDNIEVWKVEISTDNVIWSGCNLIITNSTIGNYTVSWSGTVTLSEGFNTVYMMVKDFAGNNKTDSRTITLDTTPPTLTITSPIPETTNQSALTITGETDGVNLTINTVSVPIINNTFSMTFNLNEGVNVFTVAASDPLGNENRIVLSIVVFDNTPPASSIAYIKSPTNILTNISGVANDDISGVKKVEISIIRGSDGYYWTGSAWSSTETWINVSKDGEVAVSGTTATWSYPWTPEPETDGVYTIKSRATDNADNIETPSSGVTFTYDTTLPTLTNIKPSNNTETESGTITVSGETDGVNVTVNGKYADVKDGKFSVTVKLGTGKNIITIIAKDLAGNTNQTTIIVKKISTEWFPPATQWIGLLVGIIVIALIAVVFVLYKKKIIKLKAPKEKTETGKVRENVLHKEKMGTGKPKENVGFLSKED